MAKLAGAFRRRGRRPADRRRQAGAALRRLRSGLPGADAAPARARPPAHRRVLPRCARRDRAVPSDATVLQHQHHGRLRGGAAPGSAARPEPPTPATCTTGGEPAAPRPALVAVVGKSDSGKTTLIETLVPELRRLGLRVGTVKHDAHDFEIDHARQGLLAARPGRRRRVRRRRRPTGWPTSRRLDDEMPLQRDRAALLRRLRRGRRRGLQAHGAAQASRCSASPPATRAALRARRGAGPGHRRAAAARASLRPGRRAPAWPRFLAARLDSLRALLRPRRPAVRPVSCCPWRRRVTLQGHRCNKPGQVGALLRQERRTATRESTCNFGWQELPHRPGDRRAALRRHASAEAGQVDRAKHTRLQEAA